MEETLVISENEFDEVDVKLPEKEVKSGSSFDGKVTHWWAHSALFSALAATGIGGAWADTSWAYYKYNHTIISGKRVKFNGKGIDLFPEMFKWALFTVLTFGIYGLWVPIRKHQWIVSKLSFEDEKYVEGYSYFDGTVLGLLGVNLFCYVISIITLGLGVPYAFCYRQRWYAKHTVIGKKRIIFTGKAGSLFGNYIKWWLLSLITFGIYGLWVPLRLEQWIVKRTRIKLKSDPEPQTSKGPIVVGIIGGILLVAAAIALFVLGYYAKFSIGTGDMRVPGRYEKNYNEQYYDDYNYYNNYYDY